MRNTPLRQHTTPRSRFIQNLSAYTKIWSSATPERRTPPKSCRIHSNLILGRRAWAKADLWKREERLTIVWVIPWRKSALSSRSRFLHILWLMCCCHSRIESLTQAKCVDEFFRQHSQLVEEHQIPQISSSTWMKHSKMSGQTLRKFF
jgi:hypothetical protein